jgi:hypothetical protein
MNNFCVITTINPVTEAIKHWHDLFGRNLIVVGDRKTPDNWNYENTNYIYPYKQPFDHYARKNFGYIEAMRNGATCIYDTDDDNRPNVEWKIRTKETRASKSYGEGWFNAYEPMTKTAIWPRGFPLSKIKGSGQIFGDREPVVSSIQQGLADGEPDVDAIYRLIFENKNEFKYQRSIYLDKNTWCPINSQSTWWFPDAFPLMYLPVNCSFRCTDIYRGLIAQRCLWAINQGVTFHSPSEVFQDRNEHDLMKDFADEVHMYLNVEKIAEILSGLDLQLGEEYVCANLIWCYCELIDHNIFPKEELGSVQQWVEDYENIV